MPLWNVVFQDLPKESYFIGGEPTDDFISVVDKRAQAARRGLRRGAAVGPRERGLAAGAHKRLISRAGA
jgi:hypothetical protein